MELERITIPWTVQVSVCCKTRERRACCGLEPGEGLVHWLRDRAREAGCRKQLVVHGTGCMDRCGSGTTVVVHGPTGRQAFKVGPDAREAVWSVVCEALTKGNGYP